VLSKSRLSFVNSSVSGLTTADGTARAISPPAFNAVVATASDCVAWTVGLAGPRAALKTIISPSAPTTGAGTQRRKAHARHVFTAGRAACRTARIIELWSDGGP